MTTSHIYMFHGYTSNGNDHWFPWLEQNIESNHHIPFKKLNFPDSDHPDVDAWNQCCDQNIKAEDGITLVGHSLGCIQVLHYLEQHDIKNVNVLLISGFDEPIWTLPELDSFTAHPVDYTSILPKVRQVTVISAIDDDSVPYPYTLTLARHLHAKFILMPSGHHFTDTGKDKVLPIALTELENLIK
ncbi:putative hydrolase YdeN [Lentilactobacillus parabuchneri]|nr:alpha/beta hydrolase [Lentilactobacillus parabuchneri]APR06729.1 Putative hydrolase YdeN [Lentilactobacillus parabuchneri]MBW0222649.1 alpha/beta hydrolase [Lentilactobacillus parabuchneri]MBW0245763.1 alpha/beta hydrolase [Lentilactobacillus parabuchneri]MBW0264196.1 alpha/beta hydrolase [Lentilactobacillus parabuchneri]MCT2884281.1 serine hydrolase family protein [Lentilactobacillus parabuchneri]